MSPPRNALGLNANESTTVRSAGLSSTDDEAFELYLEKQKQLQALRQQQSRQQLGEQQQESGGTVADMEAREFEAISEASSTDSLEEQDDDEIELGHMQEIVDGLWIGDVVAARDGKALQEAGIVCLPSFPAY